MPTGATKQQHRYYPMTLRKFAITVSLLIIILSIAGWIWWDLNADRVIESAFNGQSLSLVNKYVGIHKSIDPAERTLDYFLRNRQTNRATTARARHRAAAADPRGTAVRNHQRSNEFFSRLLIRSTLRVFASSCLRQSCSMPTFRSSFNTADFRKHCGLLPLD